MLIPISALHTPTPCDSRPTQNNNAYFVRSCFFQMARFRWHTSRISGLAGSGWLSFSFLVSQRKFLFLLHTDFGFALYRLDSGQKVLSSSFVSQPIRQARSPGPAFTSAPVPVRLDTSTFFSAPFGFVLEGDLKPLANRGLMPLPVWYSPDGKFLVGIAFAEFFKVDLATFKRENLPSSFRIACTRLAASS